MKRLFSILTLALMLGCATKKLEPGGAYSPGTFTPLVDANGTTTMVYTAASSPDFAFFTVDSLYDLTEATLDGVFKFERENRAMLWQVSPKIKHMLDDIRAKALPVKNSYLTARAVYKANPIPANLGVMQETLARLQSLAAAAQTATTLKGD